MFGVSSSGFYPLLHDILAPRDQIFLRWFQRVIEDRQTNIAFQADEAQLEFAIHDAPEGYLEFSFQGFSQKLPKLLEEVLRDVFVDFREEFFGGGWSSGREGGTGGTKQGVVEGEDDAGRVSAVSRSSSGGFAKAKPKDFSALFHAQKEADIEQQVPVSSATSKKKGVSSGSVSTTDQLTGQQSEQERPPTTPVALAANRLRKNGHVETQRQRVDYALRNVNLDAARQCDRLRKEILTANVHDCESLMRCIEPVDSQDEERVFGTLGPAGPGLLTPPSPRRAGGGSKGGSASQSAVSSGGATSGGKKKQEPFPELPPASKAVPVPVKLVQVADNLDPVYEAFGDYVHRFLSAFRVDMLICGNLDEGACEKLGGAVRQITQVDMQKDLPKETFAIVGGSGSSVAGVSVEAASANAPKQKDSKFQPPARGAGGSTPAPTANDDDHTTALPPALNEQTALCDATLGALNIHRSFALRLAPDVVTFCVQSSPDPNQKNNAITLYWQFGASTPETLAGVEWLYELMNEPIYDELRTKQQLGRGGLFIRKGFFWEERCESARTNYRTRRIGRNCSYRPKT